ncbi:EAL domain-containing protein [Moritella sp. 5]|uniref:bifunctional diguanylate cyclase/phosphodiesterase n=1 Tax=Moritella sp. 5 TaxID=2746231 RepID=UPI001BA92769|nr:EAL domain-containing protein [Moritella sp. 5]QUM79901.1 EAL domain-containing protein [Moritella sp. 5]
MTLFKQIYSLLFGLFVLVMSSLVYFQFTETRDFMAHQMESELNNTTTSLSLMLKPHLQTGDIAAVETLVNVIFEGGFYRKVNLTWLADQKQQSWENPIVVEGVPQWFIDLGLFEVKTKESLIQSGWLQLAKLKIEAHPGLGYRELWRVMNDTLLIISFLFLLSIFVLHFHLKHLLKPLHDIASHASNISQRVFNPDMDLPATAELRVVVKAINSMSGQLKQVFQTLDDEVDSLKHDNLVDRVSNLPNRQYLTGQVTSWLTDPGYGGLLLAKLDWLNEVHSKYGYQVRDESIRVLAFRMTEQLPDVAECVIARISNTEFAFLITKGDHQKMASYLQALIRLINQEMFKAGCMPNSDFAIGITERNDEMTPSELLAQADNALQQALIDNKTSSWFNSHCQHEFNREEWRKRLLTAINHNQFVFQWQPILQMDSGEVLQRELYCRLNIDGQQVKAGQFMPYVELLSLGSQLDRCLLESLISQNILDLNKEPVAVNLTQDSLLDPTFHSWLAHFLQNTISAEQIYIEITESSASNNPHESSQLASIVRRYGAHFGIDHCGRQMGSLSYLQQLKPDYVKLDQSLSVYSNNQQNNELCRALINIGKGLSIDVIITAIENQQQLDRIKPLRAQGYQGYISSPEDVINNSGDHLS